MSHRHHRPSRPPRARHHRVGERGVSPRLARTALRTLLGALPLVGALLLPRAVSAQAASASIDVGGAVLRYADSLRATAVTLAPAVQAGFGPATVMAYGTGSRLDVGSWSVQGGLAASVFSPALGPVRGELAGSAGGSAHRDGTRTGETRGSARLHLTGGRGGVWAGGGLGRTSDGILRRGVRVAEAGGWASVGPTTFSATVTPTTVDDTLRYTDAEAFLRVVLGRADVDLSAGLRSGAPEVDALGGDRGWGGASVTWWLADRIAAVASAGTYPVSLTQGFPGGRYATFGVRLATRAAGSAEASAAPSLAGVEAATDLTAFQATDAGGGRRTLVVRAPAARELEVAGDFTGWQAVPLVRGQDGWWAVTLPIPHGVHQVNLRLDRGEWRVPPGLPSVSDEFGGRVGLLVIE